MSSPSYISYAGPPSMGDDDHAVEDEQQSGFDVVHGDCSFNGHHYGAWGRELRPGEVIVMSIDRSMTSVDSAVIQHSKDMWVSGGLYAAFGQVVETNENYGVSPQAVCSPSTPPFQVLGYGPTTPFYGADPPHYHREASPSLYSDPILASSQISIAVHQVPQEEPDLPAGRIETVACPIPGCHSPVPTDAAQRLKHIRGHPFHNRPNSKEQLCPCAGCLCSGLRRESCPTSDPHPAHTKEIAQHIVDHHMDIVWPCSDCGKPYTTERSLKRHQNAEGDCVSLDVGTQICGVCRFPYRAGHRCAS